MELFDEDVDGLDLDEGQRYDLLVALIPLDDGFELAHNLGQDVLEDGKEDLFFL